MADDTAEYLVRAGDIKRDDSDFQKEGDCVCITKVKQFRQYIGNLCSDWDNVRSADLT